MATVVLFHSALGRRPAVATFAEALRGDGHTVHTPDLYAGAVFDDLDAGVAERDRVGIPTLLDRAWAAVAELPAEVVYAGFSLGGAPAAVLATGRPGARGLVLMHGALAPSDLGLEAWPADLPVQVHTSAGDPWVEAEALAALQAAVPATRFEHHEYPGDAHLFDDAGLAEHDPAATRAMTERVRAFLAGIDAA